MTIAKNYRGLVNSLSYLGRQKEFFYRILIENETLEQLLEKQIEKISKIENTQSKEQGFTPRTKKEVF